MGAPKIMIAMKELTEEMIGTIETATRDSLEQLKADPTHSDKQLWDA